MRSLRILGLAATAVFLLLLLAQVRGWGTPLLAYGELPNYTATKYLYGVCILGRWTYFAELAVPPLAIACLWIAIELYSLFNRLLRKRPR